MNTQPNALASYETLAERAFRQSHAIAMVRATLPALAKRTEALLNAMPDATPWTIRFRARCIAQELETLQADLAAALGESAQHR
jgi:hypothetical protein